MTEAVLKVCGTCPGRAHSVQRRGSGSGWQWVVNITTLRAFMADSLHILMRSAKGRNLYCKGEGTGTLRVVSVCSQCGE